MLIDPTGTAASFRPVAAAFVTEKRSLPTDPADQFAPGTASGSPAAPEVAPSSLTPLEFRTYRPVEGGYQEVRQFSVPRGPGPRPVLSRASDGHPSFVFANDEAVYSVASGGEVTFRHPLEGKFGGLLVHPEDGRVFVQVDNRLQELSRQGKLLNEQTLPLKTRSVLMDPDGQVYLTGESGVRKLSGGPELPLEGAAGHVAELATGHTVVTEWQRGTVRVFDPSGQQQLATDGRVSNLSLSPQGRLVYQSENRVHSYDVPTGRDQSFSVGGYLRDILPLADGRLVLHDQDDLTRADLRVVRADGSEEKKFTIKGGCLMDLQAAPDGKSLLATIDRWDRKPSSTDLVRIDLGSDGLGARLGELLSNQHGQTVIHSVPEKEGLMASFLPNGSVLVVDRKGALLDGQRVGDQAALEARLGIGAQRFVSDNLLDPSGRDLDAAFRDQMTIRPKAELDRFYRQQGAFPSGGALEFPGPRLERLPGPSWEGQGREAVVKSLLATEETNALTGQVLPFGGPGGAVLRTGAHQLEVELPLGEGKFRSLSFLCEGEDFGGGMHWEESWTHALPVQVGERHSLCAANDKNQVFFIDLSHQSPQLKHVTLEHPVRSMSLSGSQVVVTAEDGTTLVIDPPRAPGEKVYEDQPAPVDTGATRVIESHQQVVIGGVRLRKKANSA